MNRTEILDTAKTIVNGARNDMYGSPEDSFGAIAELWTAYTGFHLTARHVAVMMILFKVGRLMHGGGSADSWVDIAGYAACGGEIASGYISEDGAGNNGGNNETRTV